MRVPTLILLLIVSLPAAGFEASALSRLRQTLDLAIGAGETPGAVLWLERGADAAHWAQGDLARTPGKHAMIEESIFDLASLTKVVATLPSIMLLVERGRVNLDAPLREYLPEFATADITIRHLLTHTSGLPAGIPKDTENPDWSGYDEGIRHATACQPDPAPGSIFRYSDVNFILLGEVVHRVSGQTLDAFARSEVFKPLKMRDTTFRPDATLRSRIAPTERDQHGEMLRGVVHDPTSRRMGGVAGHAGLFSTASDLARYARMMLRGECDGVRLFKAETLQQMRSVQTPAAMPEQRGLGWDIDSKYSRPRGLIYPAGSFGHTGFTGTALWMDPGSDSFYVLLTSRLHPDGKGDVRELYEDIGTQVAAAVGAKTGATPRIALPERTVLNGIDVLEHAHFTPLSGLRIGLITNHTGIDRAGKSTIDLVHAAGNVQLVRLFSPEHGIRGQLDQEEIKDDTDKKSGLKVISLYGGSRVPKADAIEDLDALVFDIQDIGCRFYTYIATLKNCLEAAAKAGKQFIVLDRINPISGSAVQGPSVVQEQLFTSCHPISIRHGMTAGELARLFDAEAGLHAKLRVIEVQGWRRTAWFDATKLPWVNPSPNMRSLTAATLYPGIGLLEYAISVGRGTDTPFEIIGAPFLDADQLAGELTMLHLPGIRFIPASFTPSTSVFEKKLCGGVRLIVEDRNTLNPLHAGIAIAHTLHRLHPKEFDLKNFNKLLQHAGTIKALKSNQPLAPLLAAWDREAAAFAQRRAPFLLYP